MTKSYIQELRKLIGSRKLIHPAARIFMINPQKELLLIRRTDNGRWGLPAGALEEGETIEDCIRREVKEETGLLLDHLQLIGIGSSPQSETVVYPNGDEVQYFTVNFYSDQWHGEMQPDQLESTDIRFFSLNHLPPLPNNEQQAMLRCLQFLKDGQVQLY